ncbi:UDP-N-acetylmuramoyl-tripeptide--D-alanyl-D-alanine ligase [Heyndrickxia vini]|uniref:UDP-N-acetylmuramoyl-tripeptide--D-alanyl-D-alanine ligase n=1 Tax=Heyndrickxia vini TaxID=1476025 RepID=A0ABX7E1P2_9BACI|nr:UDP-N-acetylmuramoyl-tripeptide--D-alanyl-D-alanine ligase [Heyndrickxia vini]QQZ09170.1 UDP-N-acetylmuramoyl-tripeptide--D-alanyl-D-alanine ligase [Heyndrickxia vini]
MIQRTISQITKMIKAENDVSQFADTMINGVCIDTRKLQPGNLFIPFKGQNVDGHKYVEDAIKNGASGAFWQKDVPNPPSHLPIIVVENTETALQELARNYRSELTIKVVGVTGSNGKTTTKDIITAVLSEKYAVQKTEGNFNNHLGLPITILSLNEETDVAVLEMGMSARGEIEFLTKMAKPDIAIITNIGEAHLQDLGSREGIAEAKLEITKGLSKDGLFIYIGDEPLLKDREQLYKNFRVKTFGKAKSNDVFPTYIEKEDNGSKFSINIAPDKNFFLPVLGEYNVLNALAGIIAALELDLSMEEIESGLKSLKLSSMRMELHSGINGTKVINDAYNASPTSMKAAIHMLENLDQDARKIVVLGDMLELGENEIQFHKEVGSTINQDKIHYVFTYGDLGKHIAESALEKFTPERVFNFSDKQDLIHSLKSVIKGNEWILVKGSRGMKLEEVVKSLIDN